MTGKGMVLDGCRGINGIMRKHIMLLLSIISRGWRGRRL